MSFFTLEECRELTLRRVFAGMIAITLLAACGQGQPQPQAESDEDEAVGVEIPDDFLPENE